MKLKFILLVLSGAILLSNGQIHAAKNPDSDGPIAIAVLVAATCAALKMHFIKSSHANVYLVDSDDIENKKFLGTIELEWWLPTGRIHWQGYPPQKEIERLKSEERQKISTVANKAMIVYLNSRQEFKPITGMATDLKVWHPFTPGNVLLGTENFLEKNGHEVLTRIEWRILHQDKVRVS